MKDIRQILVFRFHISIILFFILVFMWFGRQVYLKGNLTTIDLFYATLIAVPINIFIFITSSNIKFSKVDLFLQQVVLLILEYVLALGSLAYYTGRISFNDIIIELKASITIGLTVASTQLIVLVLLDLFRNYSIKNKSTNKK